MFLFLPYLTSFIFNARLRENFEKNQKLKYYGAGAWRAVFLLAGIFNSSLLFLSAHFQFISEVRKREDKSRSGNSRWKFRTSSSSQSLIKRLRRSRRRSTVCGYRRRKLNMMKRDMLTHGTEPSSALARLFMDWMSVRARSCRWGESGLDLISFIIGL